MTGLPWVFADGGRAEAGYRGRTDDCACRAIAIAAQMPYQEVYDLITAEGLVERPRGRQTRSHPRTGVFAATMRRLLDRLGATWTPTMTIGSGTTVHLAPGELPDGRLIARVSKHFAAVIDGTLYDTHDCCRDGTRAVYGYWKFG